jgi:hypothetical protein
VKDVPGTHGGNANNSVLTVPQTRGEQGTSELSCMTEFVHYNYRSVPLVILCHKDYTGEGACAKNRRENTGEGAGFITSGRSGAGRAGGGQ